MISTLLATQKTVGNELLFSIGLSHAGGGNSGTLSASQYSEASIVMQWAQQLLTHLIGPGGPLEELFIQDSVFERMFGVKHQFEGNIPVLEHVHADDMAHFMRICSGADGALVIVHDFKTYTCTGGQYSTFPPTWPEWRYGSQRYGLSAQGQN